MVVAKVIARQFGSGCVLEYITRTMEPDCGLEPQSPSAYGSIVGVLSLASSLASAPESRVIASWLRFLMFLSYAIRIKIVHPTVVP